MTESPRNALAILAISLAAVFVIGLVSLLISSSDKTLEPALQAERAETRKGTEEVTVKRVTVNGAPLSQEEIRELETRSGGSLEDGSRYWYDPVSGLWGEWGGPAAGALPSGLKVHAPLPLEASGGQTNVIVNGRALHSSEVAQLITTYGQVIPGRYWLDSAGNVGVEGGPAQFNIHTRGPARSP